MASSNENISRSKKITDVLISSKKIQYGSKKNCRIWSVKEGNGQYLSFGVLLRHF